MKAVGTPERPRVSARESPESAGSPLSTRTLKIEADGDFFKGRIKPKIRIMGRWLERAGFNPGNRVKVICIAPGIIELRTSHTAIENDQASQKESA